MKEFRLRPAERLKSRQTIQDLFKKGKSFGMYPLRLVYMPIPDIHDSPSFQCTISIPKRSFKKAVHRNRIRRQVREAWRLQKSILFEQIADRNVSFAFMILYTAKEPMPYKEIEKAMKRMIRRFLKIHN
ncbi:MAG: ribonuclease P protein component [Saprospiraceae bacterium]|nr:ribonuclease P protein component [Saprospiraceae bacterium]